MPRIRRHLPHFFILLPALFICGKLLLTPINAHILVGFANPGGPIHKDYPERGWPWLYDQTGSQDAFDEITWPSCQTSNIGFSTALLLADLAVLSIPIAVLALLACWWRERSGGWLTFSLGGLMVFVAMVATACGWWAHHARQTRQEREVVKEWDESIVSYPAYDGPQWLRRLLPEDALEPFHHYSLVYLDVAPDDRGLTVHLPERNGTVGWAA